MFNWDASLSPERKDTLLNNLALKVHGRGMHTPAIIFLEMHKPLAFFASQGLLLASGFLAPLIGPQNLQEYCKLLESRENVENLIMRIEGLGQQSTEKRAS